MVRMGLAIVLGAAIMSGALCAQTYANSPYTTGTGYSSPDYINRVTILNGSTVLLNNPNTGPQPTPFNTFFPAAGVANLVPGVTHTIQIENGLYWGAYFTVWVDYNNDGTYNDTNERVTWSTAQTGTGGVASLTFTPATGVGGQMRLRVRSSDSTAAPHTCYQTITFGEAEDYLVNLGFAVSTASPLASGAIATTYNQVIQATNGTVPYTWNTSITGLPSGIVATQGSNQLTLSGTPTAQGNYNFTVTVTDSSTPPKQAQKTFDLFVAPQPIAAPFLDTFTSTTGLGWQVAAPWSIGTATAYSATGPARTEPSTDATPSTSDNRILGDRIGNDYIANDGTVYYATSPRVNCTNLPTVRLRFQRWLGCSIGTTASIQVSNNGVNWIDVWSSTGGTSQTTINDAAWLPFQYDITSVAAGNATVQVRFAIGPTATVHTGWCIDDVEIFEPGPDLEVREGGTGGTPITNNQAVGGLRDFGQVTMGVQSSPLTIALTNNGGTSCTFGAFVKGGTNPNDFYVQAGSMANPLASGGTTTFTLQFFVATTGTPGIKTATITIPHNAGGVAGQNFVINLRGEATSPGTGSVEAFETSTSGAAIAHQQSATGTARDFGSVLVGSQSVPLTIVISNPGPGTLTMNVPDIAGTWWNQFQLNTTGFLTSLPQGQTTSFTILFAPTSQGVKDAFIRVPNTKLGGPTPFEIPVLGNGLATVPAFEARIGSTTGPVIAHNDPAATTARDFGDQSLTAGATTPPLTIVINNPGGQALVLGAPTLGGANPGEFVLNTTGFTTNLQAGTNTSFTVAFDPSSVGQKDAEISITHNDTAQPTPFLILITGNGVTTFAVIQVRESNSAGAILTNPAPANGILNFGNRAIGAGPGPAATIYVANNGTAALNLGVPALLPSTTEFVLDVTGFAGAVPVGQSRTFTIRFSPGSLGTKTAQVVFSHNGVGTATPFRLNITGNGVPDAPYVEVREGSGTGPLVPSSSPATPGSGRDLGNIDVASGPSAAKVIAINNPGTQDLVLGTPTLSGPDAAHFSLNTAGFTATVAAGGTTQFSISFDPTNVGLKDAQVELTHNDTNQPSPYILPIRGRGTSPTGVVVATTTLPNGDLGKAYTPTMLAASQGVGPYTWSMYNSALPRGLSLASSGLLDGVPSDTVGVFTFTVRVTDSTGGTDDKMLSVAIAGTVLGKQPGGANGGGGGCAAAGAPLAPFALGLVAMVAWRRRRKQ